MSFSPYAQNNLKIDLTTAPDTVLFNANLSMSYSDMLDAECDEDCDLNCVMTLSENRRRAAYDKFCDVAVDVRVAQNLYLLRSCIVFKVRTVDTDIIEQTAEFWLGDEIKIEVCKKFFARTLGLPDARLDALFEPETLEWFSRYCKPAHDYGEQRPMATIFDNEQPCSEFVLNSRKHLEKDSWAFVEETDSDAEIYLDDIPPSVYKNVITHIQTTPRIVNTWTNEKNKQNMLKFECSINYRHMYLNYLQTLSKNKKKVNEKQYKKIYNRYVETIFMV